MLANYATASPPFSMNVLSCKSILQRSISVLLQTITKPKPLKPTPATTHQFSHSYELASLELSSLVILHQCHFHEDWFAIMRAEAFMERNEIIQ